MKDLFSIEKLLLSDFLSLKTDVNVPYLQKVISKTNFKKTHILVGIWKVADKKNRIRIRV